MAKHNEISVVLTKNGERFEFPSLLAAELFICPRIAEKNRGSLVAYYKKIQRPLRGYKINESVEI